MKIWLASCLLAIGADANQCPFQLEIWKPYSSIFGRPCFGSPDSTSEISANSACHSNDEYDSPGNYRATCNDQGQFVFLESGCQYKDCRASFDETSCTPSSYDKFGHLYASLDINSSNNTLDLNSGVNQLGHCYSFKIDPDSGIAEEIHYRISGDCNCTWAPTISLAPNISPSAEPTRESVNRFEGLGIVTCDSDTDKCDISRCDVRYWDDSITEGDVDSRGSDGKVTFRMESASCEVSCGGDCTFATGAGISAGFSASNSWSLAGSAATAILWWM